MLISFLKKDEDEEGGSKFMGKGDIIFLFVLGALIFGFWYYHTSTKEKTYSHYADCEALFATDSFLKAKECYESAIDLGYRIDSLDSIGYHRVEKIDSILTSTKEKTYSQYANCETLFAADSLLGAKECYESAMDLGYRVDSLDSIGHHRVEKIDSILFPQ